MRVSLLASSSPLAFLSAQSAVPRAIQLPAHVVRCTGRPREQTLHFNIVETSHHVSCGNFAYIRPNKMKIRSIWIFLFIQMSFLPGFFWIQYILLCLSLLRTRAIEFWWAGVFRECPGGCEGVKARHRTTTAFKSSNTTSSIHYRDTHTFIETVQYWYQTVVTTCLFSLQHLRETTSPSLPHATRVPTQAKLFTGANP